jgi:hypothetical protein
MDVYSSSYMPNIVLPPSNSLPKRLIIWNGGSISVVIEVDAKVETVVRDAGGDSRGWEILRDVGCGWVAQCRPMLQ